MDETVAITLPVGWWRDGARRQQVRLRPLRGADEAFLVEQRAGWPVAARTTALLGRCVTGLAAPGAEGARLLTVGDREALLLQLRRAAFGDRLEAVVECLEQGCGEKLELALAITDLLQSSNLDATAEYEEAIAFGDRQATVRFRLPTGADQEAAASVRFDLDAGVRLLVERCVLAVDNDSATDHDLEELAEPLAARWARLDPQAETMLDLECPECGTAFRTALDAAGFFFAELAATGRFLYQEVHALATRYHWSEAEILDIPLPRRRRYLEYLGWEPGPEMTR